MNFKEIWINLKIYFAECRRVLTITQKPSNAEFQTITKVSGLGLLLIGLIGFLVVLIAQLVK